MSISYERALLLLSVVEKAASHGTLYSAMIGSAGFELDDMNKAAQQEANDRAKVAAEAAAEAKAKEDARLEKIAEEEAAREEAQKKALADAASKPSIRRPVAETSNA